MNAQSFHIMAESTLSSAMNSRSQLDASAPIWTPKTVQQASPYYPVGMQAHHPHQHAHHQHAHPQQQQQWQPVAPGSPLLGSPVHQHHQSISPGSPLLGSSPGTGVFLPSSSPSSRRPSITHLNTNTNSSKHVVGNGMTISLPDELF